MAVAGNRGLALARALIERDRLAGQRSYGGGLHRFARCSGRPRRVDPHSTVLRTDGVQRCQSRIVDLLNRLGDSLVPAVLDLTLCTKVAHGGIRANLFGRRRDSAIQLVDAAIGGEGEVTVLDHDARQVAVGRCRTGCTGGHDARETTQQQQCDSGARSRGAGRNESVHELSPQVTVLDDAYIRRAGSRPRLRPTVAAVPPKDGCVPRGSRGTRSPAVLALRLPP